jgi:hypothetical protein
LKRSDPISISRHSEGKKERVRKRKKGKKQGLKQEGGGIN